MYVCTYVIICFDAFILCILCTYVWLFCLFLELQLNWMHRLHCHALASSNCDVKKQSPLSTRGVHFTSLSTSPPQFKENMAHCCGTRNKRVTTDLNSTSWNVGQISVLSALSARHKGRRTKMGWKKERERGGTFFFCSTALSHISSVLVTMKQSKYNAYALERCDSHCGRGLTYTLGSIQRGVISLRTLAEVAANSIRAFTYTAETWNVCTLVQICRGKKRKRQKNIKYVSRHFRLCSVC